MIRSTYRNIMLGILMVSLGVSFYMFRTSQDFQLEIANWENDIIRLTQERENAQSLHVALIELDNLTITEQTATQLDILRHLGLEQSELDFQMESRDVQAVGSTSLYIHNVRISGKMPYQEAMALLDRLQNTKKIILDSIEVAAPLANEGNNVGLVLAGKIYGLDKTLPQPGEVPTAEAPAAAITEPLAESSPTVPVDASATATVSASTIPTSATTLPVSSTHAPVQASPTEVTQ